MSKGWIIALVLSVAVHICGLLLLANMPRKTVSGLSQGGNLKLVLGDISDPSTVDVADDLQTEEDTVADKIDTEVSTEPQLEPEPQPQPEPEPQPQPKPEPQQQPKPEPQQQPKSEPETELKPKTEPGTATRNSTTTNESDTTAQNSELTPASEQRNATQAGADPEAIANYQQQLAAWLLKHKRYPRSLKRRGIQGQVTLSFSLDPNGNLLDSSIVQSSGVDGLDKAALEILTRANPMPPLPDSLGLSVYKATVPIRYSLK